MTAMNHSNAQEFWRIDPEFRHIEVSNTGRVRNATTKVPLPVYGSGGKAFVKLVDSHGRKHERNLRRLVRRIFGTAPLRIDLVDNFIESLTPVLVKENNMTTPQFACDFCGAQFLTVEAINTHYNTAHEGEVMLRWPGIINGYRITNTGKIVNPKGVELKAGIATAAGNSQRLTVSLMRTGDTEHSGPYAQVRVDELVATHFIGPRPGNSHTVRHRNGNDMDCRAENLEWIEMPHRFNRSAVTAPRRRTGRTRTANASGGKWNSRVRRFTRDANWRLVVNNRVVPDHYWVSQEGQIRGLQDQDLSRSVQTDGHVSVYLRAKNKSGDSISATTFRVDQIVLEAFAGERPTPKHKPHHLNGDSADCRAENLVWAIPGKPLPVPPVPTPTPQPATPVITPTKAEITVSTTASYRAGELVVNVTDGKLELPPTVNDPEALALILNKILEDRR